jgi:anti-sigma factor RsiW
VKDWPSSSCDSSREAISRSLDCDLSDFEARRLAAHLDVCEQCVAFQAGIAATATSLRTAPLERLEWPVTLPRRRVLRPMRATAAAALAAAAALVLTVTAPFEFDRSPAVRLAAPKSSDLRIVLEGEQLPADRRPTVGPMTEPIPE